MFIKFSRPAGGSRPCSIADTSDRVSAKSFPACQRQRIHSTRYVGSHLHCRGQEDEGTVIRGLRGLEHVRVCQESLPERVADDVLAFRGNVFTVILSSQHPTRQLLHTLLKLKAVFEGDIDVVEVSSPFQHALRINDPVRDPTVFSTSILYSCLFFPNRMSEE